MIIGFRTSNRDSNSFNPWNPDALRYIGVGPGAIDPTSWSYDVRGNLYQVPKIARKGHECGGSINVRGSDTKTGQTIEFSHIFYIDTTRHGGKPDHWNHELWIRKGRGKFTPFDKKKTRSHSIPISDWIEIWLKDHEGNTKSKKVIRPKGRKGAGTARSTE